MRIACISDMHGNLKFDVEECDILLCAGDSLPYHGEGKFMGCEVQRNFIISKLIPWFQRQPAKDIVLIAGNHDWIFELDAKSVPQWPGRVHYLLDEEIEVQGLRIYGTPHQPIFNNWAFNRTPERLEMFFSKIPEGIDILLSHTAPYKILDKVDFPNKEGHFGCKVLKKRIKEVKPKYVVFGHFHGCYGIVQKDYMGDITFVNASLLDEQYEMSKKPIYMEV